MIHPVHDSVRVHVTVFENDTKNTTYRVLMVDVFLGHTARLCFKIYSSHHTPPHHHITTHDRTPTQMSQL
jgi:hypothetical protein